VGSFVGTTAPLIKSRFREAKGGVLFIDEAYSLCDGWDKGFGDEAINTIVQEMENHRDDVIVIFAGYPEPMEQFLERNPGMRSRIAFHVQFEDYSTDELCEITRLMACRKNLSVTDAAMRKLRAAYDAVRTQPDYGNGRFVRKMLEEAEMNMAVRLLGEGRLDGDSDPVTTIEECDIPEAQRNNKTAARPIGFAAA
jgi:SpoVK/Ycf46/Vps4 family AAA+-type ATPase